MEIDEIFSQAVLCVKTGHSSSDSFMIPESSASPTVQTFGASVNLDALRASAVPEKTKKQTNWCVSRWKEWARSRNISTGEEQAPEEPIEMSDLELGYWIQQFVTEIRKKDGAVYPSETLYALVCGIQRYIRIHGKRPELDFFTNPVFSELKLSLDAEMKRIGGLRIGTKRKKAEVISVEQEERLWSSGVLGDKSPQILLNTVV